MKFRIIAHETTEREFIIEADDFESATNWTSLIDENSETYDSTQASPIWECESITKIDDKEESNE